MGLYRNGQKIAGKGTPGKSAYSYAVSGGYTGSEQDFTEFLGKAEYMQYYCMNQIFKIEQVTLNQSMFTDNTYVLSNENITSKTFVDVYYSVDSLDVVSELGLYEESIDGGIKFVAENPLDTFSIVIDAIVVMNINYDPTQGDIFTIDEGKITNSTAITGGGYAIDARQLNKNVSGSFANEVLTLIEKLQTENASLKERLDLLTTTGE